MNDIFEDVPDLNDEPVRHRSRRPTKPKPKAAAINVGDHVKVVYWHVIRCPYCDSKKVPVYHSASPVRYHKCLNPDCPNPDPRKTFKSIEK